MNQLRIALAILATSFLSAPAFAHTDGDYHGFVHGVAHMFSGADHLVIAAVVGFWASSDLMGRGSAVLAVYGAALLGAGLIGVALPGSAVDGLLLALLFAAGVMLVFGRHGWSARLGSMLAIALAGAQGFSHVADMASFGGDIAANAEFVAGLAGATIVTTGAAALAGFQFRKAFVSR